MWAICLQNTQTPVEETKDLIGDKEACVSWLVENQVFYTEDNLNPITDEAFGSKYVLLDLEYLDNVPDQTENTESNENPED